MTIGLLDPKIVVTIVIAQAPVEQQKFGLLYVPEPGSASFSGETKSYASPTEVATSFDAGEINQATKDALDAAFALALKPRSLKVANIPAGTQQDMLADLSGITFVGAGETYTVDVDGTSFTHTTAGLETAQTVADAIRVGLAALLAGTHTLSAGIDSFEIENDIGTNPSTVTGSYGGSATSGPAISAITAATDPGDAMDALLADDSDWYAFSSEIKTTGWQNALDDWAETNKRVFVTQSSDARCLTADPAAITEIVKAANRAYTTVRYHDDDTQEHAYLLAAHWLAGDPDLVSVDPAYAQLTGITVPAGLDSSEVTILETANAGYYGTLRGTACASPMIMASGLQADNRLTVDWLEARIGEAHASLLLQAAATQRKVPYTDPGFSQVRSKTQGVLDLGVSIGHLRVILDSATNLQTSPLATVPRRSDVTPADEAARRVPVEFTAHTANSVQEVVVNGYLETGV